MAIAAVLASAGPGFAVLALWALRKGSVAPGRFDRVGWILGGWGTTTVALFPVGVTTYGLGEAARPPATVFAVGAVATGLAALSLPPYADARAGLDIGGRPGRVRDRRPR
ncbi:hypothetical protein ACN20G_17025 [Streptomyces sp. BI20]|uniref:hypothetical protein n=1 Tax=Streptomyces sp. BI20 TaxID=3403460 RepID=UPI003C72EFA6